MSGAGPLLAAPLAPDPDVAREWLESELSDPAYAVAEPTLFDRVSRAVADFFTNLFSADIPDSFGPAAAVIATVVVVVVVVTALLIWGRPRRTTRTRAEIGPVFGDDDSRSSAQLRRDAIAAAADGAWDDAIVLRFRAIARALAERAVVDPTPGATAQAFARESAAAFPAEAVRLSRAAGAFDDVRYLRRPGTRELAESIAALDDALAAQRPALSLGAAGSAV